MVTRVRARIPRAVVTDVCQGAVSSGLDVPGIRMREDDDVARRNVRRPRPAGNRMRDCRISRTGRWDSRNDNTGGLCTGSATD